MSEQRPDLSPPGKGQFLVYEAENSRIKIDVRLEQKTVWLSLRLMAELFQKDVRTINEHYPQCLCRRGVGLRRQPF